MRLNDDKICFYDALAANASNLQVMGVDELKVIATELVMKVRQSVMINYTEHAWPALLDTAGLNTP